MRYRLFAILTFWCSSLSLVFASNEYSIEAKPDWVASLPSSKPPTESESQGSNGTLFLLVDEQLNFATRQSQHYYHYAQKITNEDGLQSASQISLDFDPSYQNVKLHNIELVRHDKTITKLDTATISVIQREKELEYSIFDGRKTVSIILDDIRVGDRIEYDYTIEGYNPALAGYFFGGLDLQWSVPVKQIFYQIIFPSNKTLYFKSHQTQKNFMATELGKNIQYRYLATDVTSLHLDKEMPEWYSPYPWIQFSGFNQWQQVVNWALPFFHLPEESKPGVGYASLNLAVDTKTPEQRLLNALKFVQNEIRYTGIEMGIGSYQPSDPELVLERRFGDCKDKVKLLLSLLQSYGFEAYPVLVNTRKTKQLDQLLPSPYVFNHVIVLVRHKNREYWLDPTLNGQGGTLETLYQPIYGQGLVIKQGNTSLTTMSANKKQAIDKEVHETFTVNEDESPTTLSVTTHYRGSYANYHRNYFRNTEIPKIEKDYVNYYADFYPGIELASKIRLNDNDEQNIFTVYEEYRIPKFWDYKENSKRFTANFYQLDLNSEILSPKYAKRTSPMDIGRKKELVVHTHIKLKDKWPIEKENKTINDPAFLLEKTVSPDKNDIRIEYHYQLLSSSIEAAQVEDYALHIEQARDLLGYALFTTELNGKSTAKPTPFTPNWSLIIIFSMSVLLSLGICFKLYQYDPEPNHARADINLVGMKGWLVIAGLGVIVSPFRYLKNYKEFFPYFDMNQWQLITAPTEAYYHHLLAPLIMSEIIANTIMFFLLVLLLVAFFKKRSSTPRLYAFIIFGSILFAFLDHLLIQQIPSLAAQTTPGEISALIGSSISSLIWVAYFLSSRRVASTFIIRRNENIK